MLETITLYCREGSSDKVYKTAVEPSGNQYLVTFAYGRRGTTLQTGTKTNTPVDYNIAKSIYDRLIREKTAKGYHPGEGGTPYQQIDKQDSGIRPHLLNPIEEAAVPALLLDPAYWLQEKHDGRRLLLQKKGSVVTGINRLGLTIGIPESLAAVARSFAQDFVIDGEAVGETLHAFDLLSLAGQDWREQSYQNRFRQLLHLLAPFQQQTIRLVETAFRPRQKADLLERMRTEGREGVVFKRSDAPYTPGRPNSGGSQFKYKFCETASFLVGRVNAKRSVGLLLFDGDKLVPLGNVTIPPNQDVPRPMQIVEVRYLYAYPGGSVFQPVYLGVRTDLNLEDCALDQLKYRREGC